MIVPTMKVWIEQWYENEPSLGKVNRNELPAARLPELKVLESEVTVCVTEPLFVQHTVVPGTTVVIDGEKAKLTIEAMASPAWHEVTVGLVGGDAALPPGSAITKAMAASAGKP